MFINEEINIISDCVEYLDFFTIFVLFEGLMFGSRVNEMISMFSISATSVCIACMYK